MSTAIIKDFVTNNGLEVEESITLGDKTVTSLVDSSTVNTIVTSPSVASSIVVAGGASTKTYDSADLLPLSGNTSGELAFVNTTNRLYLWNGSGWYGIALINTSPTFDVGGAPASSYTLDSNGGSPTTITLNATDPEGASIQYSYLSSDASSFATISQSNNVFTVTALSDSALDSNGYAFGGTFDVTFRASDGVNIVPAISSFTITIEVNYDWATSTQQGSRFTTAQTSGAAFFGYSVGMSQSGNSLIVGARGETLQANGSSGNSKGTASIYTRSGTTWSFQQRLVSSSYTSSEQFGYSVDMSGDGNAVVIGSPFKIKTGETYQTGGAQIWLKNEDDTWEFESQLFPPVDVYSSNETDHYFAQAVAIDGTGSRIVIGARGKNHTVNPVRSDVGAVFVYKNSGVQYYNVESATSLTGKSVNAEDADGTGFEFNNDGTKMYITGYATDSIYQYSLSTAFDVSTATYDNVSLDISATNPYPTCLKFNNDGTKLWVVSPNSTAGTSESIYEYGFTTPYDLSTASYSNVNIDLSSQESRPHGIDFSPDGTKMFMIGWTDDRVFQYDLSTAWDITSLTFSKSSFVISSQDGVPKGLALNGDGTKIFITGDTYNKIFIYNLSTPYDVSSMTYSGNSIDASEGSPFQVGFNNDGSRMYLLGIGSNMRQWKTAFINYALESILYNNDKDQSAGWGSSVSITPDGSTMAIGGRDYSGGRGMFYVFKRSGTSWSQFGNRVVASDGASNDYFAGGYTNGFGIDISGNGNTIVAGAVGDDDNSQSMSGSVYIYENTSTSTYDVGNMVYTQRNFDFDLLGSNERRDAAGFAFNNDGTKLFMGDYATDAIHQYSLSSPYDVSSAVYDYIGFDVSDRVEYIYGLRFKPDGTSFYIVDYNLDDIFQYNLSTAWDITSASYANTLDVSTNANNPYGFSFKPDGTKLFVVGNNSDIIAAYNLSTAWDISSASYASENFSVTSQASNPQDVIFNSAGTKMYVLCVQNDRIYQYSLSTAWDVSSASYDSVSFYLYNYVYGESIGEGRQIEFNSDGTRLWIVDSSQSKIFEFSTTTPTWTETKLTSPNPSSSGYYGHDVAIDDENSVIIVGANRENSNTGRVYVYQRTGATWNSSTVQKKELASLTSDLQTNNEFGWSVAVSRGGADAVVGATEVDVGSSTQAGAIYIFTAPKTTVLDWTTGSLSQTIDGLPTQYNRYSEKFGTDCDLSSNGDYAVIGSPDFLNAGRTFIFYRSGSTWSQQAAIDPPAGGQMGSSVAINNDGDTAIVAATSENYSGAAYGAVYIYTRSGSTWSQQARLTSSYNVAGTSRFGNGDETDQGKGVDISDDGNVVIIGAINEDPSNIANAGRAYIFRRSGSTWSLDAALQASDPQAGDVFGWSVSISGDGNYAVIGAREEAGGSGNPYSSIGASYVFTYSSGSWSQQAKLTPNPLASAQRSGHSVGIDQDGDTIAVGALYETTTATNSGAVYVFTRSGSTWTQQETLKANDAAAHDNLGTSVDISNDGDIISVGAMNEDDSSTTNNGAIYIFKRSGSSWSQVKKFAGTLTDQKLGKQHRMSKDATVIISGDYKYNSNQGRAYIFEA